MQLAVSNSRNTSFDNIVAFACSQLSILELQAELQLSWDAFETCMNIFRRGSLDCRVNHLLLIQSAIGSAISAVCSVVLPVND